MRTIQTALPSQELGPFVRSYAQREITCAGAGFDQPNIASLEHTLSFDFATERSWTIRIALVCSFPESTSSDR